MGPIRSSRGLKAPSTCCQSGYFRGIWCKRKPIFHRDAKPFTLGTFASPNAKDTNMLVSFVLGDANFPRHPTQNPKASQWNIGCVGSSGVGHVYFMLFVHHFPRGLREN